jgi:hypothetical protein
MSQKQYNINRSKVNKERYSESTRLDCFYRYRSVTELQNQGFSDECAQGTIQRSLKHLTFKFQDCTTKTYEKNK